MIPSLKGLRAQLRRLIIQRNYWRTAVQQLQAVLPPPLILPIANMAANALATYNLIKLDTDVGNKVNAYNNEPRTVLSKIYIQIPDFDGQGDIDTYIEQVKSLVTCNNLPTGIEPDEAFYTIPAAAVQNPNYTYIVGNAANYRGGPTGNSERDGQVLVPHTNDGGGPPVLQTMPGKEPKAPTGHCERAKQVVDALTRKWKGMAQMLWQNTPEHQKPRTLEPYQFFYTDNAGNEQQIPQATGFYQFVEQHFQSAEKEAIMFEKWTEMKYYPGYPGGITRFNVEFLNTMQSANVTMDNSTKKFIVPRYIEAFQKYYPDLYDDLVKTRDSRLATGQL